MLDKEEGREAEDKEEFLALANGEPRSLSVESSRHQGGTALVILVIKKVLTMTVAIAVMIMMMMTMVMMMMVMMMMMT